VKGAWALLSLALVSSSAAAAPPDAGEQHLRDVALACIKSRAAEVERVETTLTEAADFLLTDLCHDQVMAHARYVANTNLIEKMRSGHNEYTDLFDMMGDRASAVQRAREQQQIDSVRAEWRTARVDPETGDLIGPAEEVARTGGTGPGSTAEMLEMSTQAALLQPSDSFRAAAGEAVLAARTARLAKP
jgi:hypothetical protein